MDSIPNEIVLQIIGCLRRQEIPKLRLVNHRFNQLATTCITKLFLVHFTEDSDIVKFISVFGQNKTVVPFEKFIFSEHLSTYGQPLEEFCVQFGRIVKWWRLWILWSHQRQPLKQNSLFNNIQILLENCQNVEEIHYEIGEEETVPTVEEEMVNVLDLPVLRKLKTIKIEVNDSMNKVDFIRLLVLLKKAPNLRNVSIQSCGDLNYHESSYNALAPNILKHLYRINRTVHIQTLVLLVQFPAVNVPDLENLVELSLKFKILNLKLFFMLRDPSSGSEPQTLEIISKWIPKLTFLRTLFVEGPHFWGVDKGHHHYRRPVQLPLCSLGNLQCLELYMPFPYESVTLLQTVEFPALTSLDCITGTTDKFIFAGCLFPNVKYANIYLKTDQERQHWPSVLPNVTDLCVASETLKGIFQFPKVQKLHIYVDPEANEPDDIRELQLQHWNHLTNGAEYISNSVITNSLPVTEKTSESIDSFRNLPLLTHLKVDSNRRLFDQIECWKGVIYASQIGQLRRLRKLVFRHNDFNEKDEYLEVLMKYHDSVITTEEHDLPPFPWNDLFHY